MKKITSLTDAQKARFGEWSNRWIQIGLSTEPADFEAATEAALKGYKLANQDRPMVILRMGSPYAATVGGAMAWLMLRSIFKDKVGDQVGAQVGDQVRAQVWDQVGAQVGDQVRAQVWDQVGAQVGDQVRAQVGDQVGAQVGAQVRAQVGDQVRAQVGAQVRDQVGDQVGAQVGAQVWDQVGAQVGAQVWDQVWAQVGAQVWDQVWAQVGGAAHDGRNNYGYDALWGTGFAAWVSFFRDVCDWQDPVLEKFEVLETLVKSCGWTWWHQNVLAISDRPRVINRDEQNRLHCETGASISYPDGWSLYHWHGVSIPGEWITGRKPTASEALEWENMEQRRAACELVGWASILKELKARVIDADSDPEIGTLVECDLPDAGKERFLRVQCGTGREFALCVPPTMKTAREANSWTYSLPAEELQLEVRT